MAQEPPEALSPQMVRAIVLGHVEGFDDRVATINAELIELTEEDWDRTTFPIKRLGSDGKAMIIRLQRHFNAWSITSNDHFLIFACAEPSVEERREPEPATQR